MVSRPYTCPKCSKVFRTESGREWHLAHRHEINEAINTIGAEYETKIVGLTDENKLLKQKKEDFESRLNTMTNMLNRQMMENLESSASAIKTVIEAQKTEGNLRKAILIIANQGDLIQRKLGIPFKNPFEEQDESNAVTPTKTTITKVSDGGS